MASKGTMNKTFICESTYFNCEQVVRTETHLMKMYRLCKRVQNFEFKRRDLEFFYSGSIEVDSIGMKIKVIDNERIF